jgi:hypothetical protein
VAVLEAVGLAKLQVRRARGHHNVLLLGLVVDRRPHRRLRDDGAGAADDHRNRYLDDSRDDVQGASRSQHESPDRRQHQRARAAAGSVRRIRCWAGNVALWTKSLFPEPVSQQPERLVVVVELRSVWIVRGRRLRWRVWWLWQLTARETASASAGGPSWRRRSSPTWIASTPSSHRRRPVRCPGARARDHTAGWPPIVPVLVHGVFAGAGRRRPPADARRLDAMARVVGAVQAERWSEHLAFVRAGGLEIGHLAAPPRTDATIEGAARNLARARAVVGSAAAGREHRDLIDPPGSEHTEADWIAGSARGVGLRPAAGLSTTCTPTASTSASTRSHSSRACRSITSARFTSRAGPGSRPRTGSDGCSTITCTTCPIRSTRCWPMWAPARRAR